MYRSDIDAHSLGTWGSEIHYMGQGGSGLIVTGYSSLSQSTSELHMSSIEITIGSHQSDFQSLIMTMTKPVSLVNKSLPKH